MAISPKDARRLTSLDDKEVTEREARIDAFVASFKGDDPLIKADMFGKGHIREILVARYEKAGWKVTFRDEPMESFFELTPKSK